MVSASKRKLPNSTPYAQFRSKELTWNWYFGQFCLSMVPGDFFFQIGLEGQEDAKISLFEFYSANLGKCRCGRLL